MIRSLWKVGALLPVHDHYPARIVSTRCEHPRPGRTVVPGPCTAGLSRFRTVRGTQTWNPGGRLRPSHTKQVLSPWERGAISRNVGKM